MKFLAAIIFLAAIMLLCVSAWGQIQGGTDAGIKLHGDSSNFTIENWPPDSVVFMTPTTRTLPIVHKHVCAFGFKPVSVTNNEPSKRDLMFPPSVNNNFAIPATLTAVTREVCPYERAIEVFGADRVYYKETIVEHIWGIRLPGVKRILVDDEEVYQETEGSITLRISE